MACSSMTMHRAFLSGIMIAKKILSMLALLNVEGYGHIKDTSRIAGPSEMVC